MYYTHVGENLDTSIPLGKGGGKSNVCTHDARCMEENVGMLAIQMWLYHWSATSALSPYLTFLNNFSNLAFLDN